MATRTTEYVEVVNLPEPIRNALKALDFRGNDLPVFTHTTVELGGSASDGEKAFTTLVNLTTGQHVTTWGSWGGPNAFDRTNPVDNDRNAYTLPGDGVVLTGTGNGSKARYAFLHIPASMTARVLPPSEGESLPDDVQWVLNVFVSNNSGGRKYEFERKRISAAALAAATETLAAGGYIKVNKAGAVSVTTKGRNARTSPY